MIRIRPITQQVCGFALSILTWHTAQAQVSPQILSDKHSIVQLTPTKQLLLLPVEESEDNAHIRLIQNNHVVKEFNCRLAIDKVDHYVPLSLANLQNNTIALDITFTGNVRSTGSPKDFVCWQHISQTDRFSLQNTETYRPIYHHTPAYGWMNDPNGMFYKDGIWHLYYQHNPFGSQWENMTWGHSTSHDLVNWTFEGDPITPDAWGAIFSGSAVVDHHNTAGFGPGAIVAMYTTAGAHQTQSMAYSLDDGKTFVKYANNPVLTADVADFRDPHLFWNAQKGFWNMILAAGQEMRIYSSSDLKAWKYESSFGQGYGAHGGVWECPDLFPLPVKGTHEVKWVLLCNINPGGPFGGSATQYFIGDFDGHRFTCETSPETTRWLDYGKDHYATVTFDNAPQQRRVAMAWMSNWQYANLIPTLQFKSVNTIPRDLHLYRYNGQTYCGVTPSQEMLALRGKKGKKLTPACEIVAQIKGSVTMTLGNDQNEYVSIQYDEKTQTLCVDRTHSGQTQFSDAFAVQTSVRVPCPVKSLRIFVDKCSIEVFDGNGCAVLSNLVFPTTPYNKVRTIGDVQYVVYDLSRGIKPQKTQSLPLH